MQMWMPRVGKLHAPMESEVKCRANNGLIEQARRVGVNGLNRGGSFALSGKLHFRFRFLREDPLGKRD